MSHPDDIHDDWLDTGEPLDHSPRHELLQELRADPEFSWAAEVIVGLLDRNRALVQGDICSSCRQVWTHQISCELNVERATVGGRHG